MGTWGPVRRGHAAARGATRRAVDGLLRHSLVAYLLAELVWRAWAVMNVDLLQLLKRL